MNEQEAIYENWFNIGHRAGVRDAFNNLAPGVYLKCPQCLEFKQGTGSFFFKGTDVYCEECWAN